MSRLLEWFRVSATSAESGRLRGLVALVFWVVAFVVVGICTLVLLTFQKIRDVVR